MSNLVTPEDLLTLWFGEPGALPLARSPQWYKKNDAFDQALRDQFNSTLESGVRGELAEWPTTPRGRLANIILYDQFSRNMFRTSARAFAQDGLAQALSLEAFENGHYEKLASVECGFVLMPLMHAENMTLQKRCIAEFQKLAKDAPEGLVGFHTSNVGYAERHAAIVERFGRFPHRNAILGRESTPEEIEFLTQPGSSF
jgi:uncharacterized protein (DUF924 family)